MHVCLYVHFRIHINAFATKRLLLTCFTDIMRHRVERRGHRNAHTHMLTQIHFLTNICNYT